MIDEAKAEMDFWVNVWVLAIIMVGEYIGFALSAHSLVAVTLIWPLAAIVIIFFAKSRARSAAIEWGDLVKASFDVYLPELRAKLEVPVESDREKENVIWDDFSRAAMYRLPSSLPSRRVQQAREDAQEASQEDHDG